MDCIFHGCGECVIQGHRKSAMRDDNEESWVEYPVGISVSHLSLHILDEKPAFPVSTSSTELFVFAASLPTHSHSLGHLNPVPFLFNSHHSLTRPVLNLPDDDMPLKGCCTHAYQLTKSTTHIDPRQPADGSCRTRITLTTHPSLAKRTPKPTSTCLGTSITRPSFPNTMKDSFKSSWGPQPPNFQTRPELSESLGCVL